MKKTLRVPGCSGDRLAALLLLALTGCPSPNPGIVDAAPTPDAGDAFVEPVTDQGLTPDAAIEPTPDAAIEPMPDAAIEPTPDAAIDPPCVPTEEICDGVDNDCDDAIDEADGGGAITEACYDGPGGTAGVGACVGGERRCIDGAMGACEGQVLPGVELCDDQDHDCDGAADDVDGLGAECSAGVGACAAQGRVLCDPVLGDLRCDAVPGAPAAEVCDGTDDDCDGAIDEADAGGVLTQACYDGPAGTEGVGTCVGGARRCLGGAFGACEGQVRPIAELCDGADNDCDGAVDDLAGLGAACSDGVGACNAPGVVICDAARGEVRCDAPVGAPVDERCDGVDNDCDGVVDDVAGVGTACTNGIGACAAEGSRVCDLQAGELVCDAVPGEPAEERCNGVDDDCNAIVDDAPGVGARCRAGLGMCGVGGRLACVGDDLACDPDGIEEWCADRTDDDADGEIDEGDCLWACEVDGHCPIEAECVQGACVFTGCANDADCGPLGLCEDGTCTPGDCRGDGDCDPDQVCDLGACVRGECRADAECAGEQICDQRVCVDVPAGCVDAPAIRGFGTVAGSTVDAPSELEGTCAVSRASERVYRMRLDYAGTVCLDTFGSTYDTVVYARRECARQASQQACNDDWGGANDRLRSRIELNLADNEWMYVVVDGYDLNAGEFRLTVSPGPCGTLCESDDVCHGFESCREPPAALPRVAFEVDGLSECGRDVCSGGAVIEGLAPWPAYAAFYTDGAAIYDVNNDRQHAGISIAVDGDTRASGQRIPGLVDLAGVRAAYAGLATSPFAVEADSLVEGFFLDRFCGDNAGVVQAEVRPVAVCTDICDFDDDCREGLVCNGRRCRWPTDTDRDGVADHLDDDDDNDGIPDAVECFGIGSRTSNGGFERPGPPGDVPNFEALPGAVPGWSTIPARRHMEFWTDGFLGIPAAEGQWFIELNARGRDTIYQDLPTAEGQRFDIRFSHRGRQGPEAMALRVGAPGATVQVLRAETGQDWVEYHARYVVPAGQPVTRFEFASLLDGSEGNLLDGVHVVPRCDGSADVDGDGRPNHRDPDADGDGDGDLHEAGHGLTQGQLNDGVGANGLADVVETSLDSGDVNYDLVDTDGDGVPDFLQP